MHSKGNGPILLGEGRSVRRPHEMREFLCSSIMHALSIVLQNDLPLLRKYFRISTVL